MRTVLVQGIFLLEFAEEIFRKTFEEPSESQYWFPPSPYPILLGMGHALHIYQSPKDTVRNIRCSREFRDRLEPGRRHLGEDEIVSELHIHPDVFGRR
ncbi:MAG: hypothetical protein ACYC4I_01885 [Minisyncoccota bacterium]